MDKPMKVSSFGQAIIQATRPRGVIAPLQIGLRIHMHHHFGSRFLDTFYSLIFSSSYIDVQSFEMNAASKPVNSDAIKKMHLSCNILLTILAIYTIRTIDGH